MTGRRTALVPLLLAVLVGCGQDAPGGTAGPSRTAASTPASASPTPGEPAPAEPTGLVAEADDTWTPWAKGGRPATDLSDLAGPGFTVAGGVVGCRFGARGPEGATVRCDRTEGLGVDEPRPADCAGAREVSWGDAVETSAGGSGRLVCAGDTVLGVTGETDGSRVLADGESVTYDGLTCTARDAAVQCLGPAARGFVVSPRVVVRR